MKKGRILAFHRFLMMINITTNTDNARMPPAIIISGAPDASVRL
jgi:hypothetical protein